MTEEAYKLRIEAEFPHRVVEGKEFKVTYKIKNIDTRTIPKGTIRVHIRWTTIGRDFRDNQDIPIENLQPNDTLVTEAETRAMTAGMTVFSPASDSFSASDGKEIWLYHVNGKRIPKRGVFAFVRARSHEEIFESWALKVSAISLVILIIFQIIDWIIRYLKLF